MRFASGWQAEAGAETEAGADAKTDNEAETKAAETDKGIATSVEPTIPEEINTPIASDIATDKQSQCGLSKSGFGKLKRISANAFAKIKSRDPSNTTSAAASDTEEASEAIAKTSQNTKEILSEAFDQVNERGERLNQLEHGTEDLAASASNFADLAKQIAEREKNRKWYEF
ncbi:hypothetical protein BDF19DRAFT_412162 [Syncephalis fuscata]|nr:hypothetical protein BDF19DRAFT_412162 [Syncephalis fuscata]